MLDMSRSDTRAIEGLPVRLVVTLVVGVTSMSVMLSMLSEVQGFVASEFDVKPTLDVVGPGEQALDFTVVGHEGNPMEGATVIVRSGTTEIDDAAATESNDGGSATVNVGAELGANREGGAFATDVKPPTGESFVNRRENTSVLVVQNWAPNTRAATSTLRVRHRAEAAVNE